MNKKRLLSIEDNPANRKIIYDLFTIRGGYEVIEAADGSEGLEKVKTEKPSKDVVSPKFPRFFFNYFSHYAR